MSTVTCTAPADLRRAITRDLAPGTSLGRYRLGELLGVGGMGTVYRAEDPALRRVVALKVLHAEYTAQERARERFMREGQILARLSHPNIATVFDVGVDGERSFLALELVEGGSLRTWLSVQRSWRDIGQTFTAIASGLAAAHAAGIVHRDIKPENILLTAAGEPRVTDFGVAGGVGASCASGERANLSDGGAIMGTPAYMAPEQRAGRVVDARADQYSLCLMWLEALGRERDTAPDEVGAARGPRWLIRILMRGLAARPEERWPSVSALVTAVRRRRRRGQGLIFASLAATLAAAVVAVRAGTPARGVLVAEPGVSMAAPVPTIVRLHAARAGEGHSRRLLAGDGSTLVISSAERDSLWVEELGQSVRESIAIPGRLSDRADTLVAASVDAEVVIVRLDDRSVWRTGRGVRAPIRMSERGNGAACLRADGTELAVGPLDRSRPLEIRSTRDGALTGVIEAGDLCAWAGDRLVLGWRRQPDHRVRLRIVDLQGGGRDLPRLPGELGSMTVHGDWLIVAHDVAVAAPAGAASTGVITAMSLVDGRVVELARQPGQTFGPIAATAAGLYVGQVKAVAGLRILDVEGRGGAYVWRTVEVARVEGAPEWLDANTLALSQGDGVVRHDIIDGGWTPLPFAGRVMSRIDGGLVGVVTDPEDPARCIAHATTFTGTDRVLASGLCRDLTVQCDGGRRCAFSALDGDDLVIRPIDARTGATGAFVLRVPLTETPHVSVGPDGRWLVHRGEKLGIVDPDTGAARDLVPDLTRVNDAVWGHDGSYVIASGAAEGAAVIAHIELGGATRILTRTYAERLLAPRVSPDGRHIVVMRVERLNDYGLLAPLPR